MKSVFIAGSRKFYQDVEKLNKLCEEKGIEVSTAGKPSDQEDTFESEKSALFRAFKEMDKSDIIYIMAKGGYVGRTVALEIAYAFAKNKEIISSDTIEEFSARALISKVMGPEELVEYAKS
ncbi:MAG: hypothetical protein ACE5FW_00965 [Candidatus Aenigmatarchaeota archaeon]